MSIISLRSIILPQIKQQINQTTLIFFINTAHDFTPVVTTEIQNLKTNFYNKLILYGMGIVVSK